MRNKLLPFFEQYKEFVVAIRRNFGTLCAIGNQIVALRQSLQGQMAPASVAKCGASVVKKRQSLWAKTSRRGNDPIFSLCRRGRAFFLPRSVNNVGIV